MICSRFALLILAAELAPGQTPPPTSLLQSSQTTPVLQNEAIPSGYAVVAGISHYQNLQEAQQLQYPEVDAQSIYTVLTGPQSGFKPQNVHILTGANATLAALRWEIETWLPSVAGDNDRVLIYFAGHGLMYEDKGYLAPFDFDPGRIAATGYPMDDLSAVIESKIHAKYKILFTDANHGGAILRNPKSQSQTGAGLRSSLFFLTASRDREVSFENPDYGHGVFTYFLIRGMQGEADASGDGIVTADELAEYVHAQVREATMGKQNPMSLCSCDPNMRISFRSRTGFPPPVAKR